MKSKKVTASALSLLTVSLFFFSSCGIIYFGNSQDDLRDLSAFASGLDAVMRTVADADALAAEGDARTVNPGTYTTSANQERVIAATPSAAYTELGGSGNTIQVPGSGGYFRSWYGNPSLNASFSMQPQGSDHYLIKLSVYDTADFLLDFVYEEYLVHKDSWEALDDDLNPGFITYYDRMTDRSTINHSAWESGGTTVYDISVPVVHEALADYTFTIRNDWPEPTLFEAQTVIEPPTRDIPGDFYFYKESTGNYQAQMASRAPAFKRPDYEAKSWYSERDGQDERTMVVYSLQNIAKSKGNVARTVTRSREVYDDHTFVSRLVRSLTSFSYRNANPWQHIAREVEQTLEGNRVRLEYTEGVYWSSSAVNGTPDRTTTMDLLQNSAGNANYSGTMEVTWKNSSWVDTYTVTFNGKTFKTKSTGGYNPSSRSVGEGRGLAGTEIEFDLAEIASGEEFIIRLPAGSRFTGTWEFGLLAGTLRYPNGGVVEIELFGGSLRLDGELWESGR